MKFSVNYVISATVAAVVCLALSPQSSVVAAPQQGTATASSDGLIFKWSKAPWPDVVEWFAEEADFILEPVDQYPDGTFSLQSDRPLSPVEGIDEINNRLRLSKPPKMLLRHGRRLFMVDVDTELPLELVETIPVSELNNRGKYEPLQVVFDISGLDMETISEQVKQRIQDHNKNFFQEYPDTNELFVRESGENLRFIRDMIERAKLNGTPIYVILNLKHISAALFLEHLSAFHDLDENYRSEKMTLVIDSPQRIYLYATPEVIRDVKNAKETFDVEAEAVTSSPDDPIVLRQYQVPRDSKEAFEIIDRLLFDAGNGARVAQGSETGNITVRGKEADHAIVAEYLGLQEVGGGFTTVQLKNGQASDILIATQTVLGITAENLGDNVNMLANTDRDFIILRGTPRQVSAAREIIEELDRRSAPVSDGLRTRRRMISMPQSEIDRILPVLEDMWPTMGRGNLFDVRPAQKGNDQDSLFRKNEKRKMMEREQGSILRSRLFEAIAMSFPATALQLSTAMLQGPDDPSPGDQKKDGYKLPEQVESIPGAPVRVWATEFGIVVESDDLDAADDVEYMIDQLVGDVSENAKPTIFPLTHIQAKEMKSILERMYGLESSGGGGGGAGILGGIADNVLGQAGGGMADALFGGGLGGGDSSNAATLEGEVSIDSNTRLNYLWVIGATVNDIDSIDQLIKVFDVSTPEHNPETAGQIYSIPVKHRSPEDMKTQVENLMGPKYFEDPEAKQGGGGGGGDAANIARLMRQVTGGGGGGGGGGDAEETEPRGFLSVDMKTSQLLFLGPKFIFVQVETLVLALDQPEVVEPREWKQLDLKGADGTKAAKMLKASLGSDKIKIFNADMEAMSGEMMEGEGGGEKPAGSTPNANAQSNQARQQQAVLQAFQRAARQGGQARGGQNRGGRGGGNGGGRGGRGGGRGGR